MNTTTSRNTIEDKINTLRQYLFMEKYVDITNAEKIAILWNKSYIEIGNKIRELEDYVL